MSKDKRRQSKDEPKVYAERPNKTVLKRENHALQAFILEAAQLSEDVRKKLPFDEPAQEILTRISGMKADTARKREVRFATKYFAEWDEAAIEKLLAAQRLDSKRMISLDKPIEKWRTKLIEGGNEELATFVAQFPESNVQQLRQLIRKAQKETADGKSSAAAQALFKSLRGLMQSS